MVNGIEQELETDDNLTKNSESTWKVLNAAQKDFLEMKCMIFQSSVSVSELKEVMINPETWISSLVSQAKESESTEQNIKGWKSQEKRDLGNGTGEKQESQKEEKKGMEERQ